MIEEFEPYVLSLSTASSSKRASPTPSRSGGLLENNPTVSPAVHPPEEENENSSWVKYSTTPHEEKEKEEGEGAHSSGAGAEKNKSNKSPFSCHGAICRDSTSNSDVYHIDLGNQSLTEPKSAWLVLGNHNPLKVTHKLEFYMFLF